VNKMICIEKYGIFARMQYCFTIFVKWKGD
jgi:hypothetical protein